MKEPVEILLRILVRGGRVNHFGQEYAMDEDGNLCVVMHDENGNDRPVNIECTMRDFKNMADRIGKDELWIQCCALSLNAPT